MSEEKPFLIAEDDDADVILMQIVIDDCAITGQFVVTRDGEEVLDYLYRRGKYRDAAGALPVLVLLDLKMPKLSGLEVLRQIRSDEKLKSIPVVIFTSSLSENDKADCLAGGASEFVIKPINFDAYAQELKRILCTYGGKG